jgi:hypothetical protein
MMSMTMLFASNAYLSQDTCLPSALFSGSYMSSALSTGLTPIGDTLDGWSESAVKKTMQTIQNAAGFYNNAKGFVSATLINVVNARRVLASG